MTKGGKDKMVEEVTYILKKDPFMSVRLGKFLERFGMNYFSYPRWLRIALNRQVVINKTIPTNGMKRHMINFV